MAASLKGKSVLVTGAGRRLGREIALAFARAGANVVAHYRESRYEALSLCAEARGAGVRAWAIAADLADERGCEELFAAACREAGGVDVLVNSAAIFPADRLEKVSLGSLTENLGVNACAPLRLARALAGQGRGGAIINLLDCRIVDYDREHVSYHLSKRILHALTMEMAVEFAPRVRVNAVAPGLVLPPAGEGEEYLARLAQTNPLNAHGRAADVAEASLFLASAEFVTGQVIYVDGGRHLRGAMYG